jgi:hypothetical protein
MKSKNLFIKIDEFIFQKIDLLKNEGFFQKFNDATANLSEDKQKITAQAVTFTCILIPFIFVFVLWWGNYQMKKNIGLKKQIIDQVALLEGNKSTLNNISSNYLAPTPLNSQDDLDARIRNLLSSNSIDPSKVSISNFNQYSTSSTVSKVEADLQFRNFGTLDFSNFLRGIVESERFKISKVTLKKVDESKLLQGTITLLHLGQNYTQSE